MRAGPWWGSLIVVGGVGFAAVAGAQEALDAPALRVVRESQVSLAIEVTAGPSGAPAGFVVEWMKAADHTRLGGWPADVAAVPELVRAQFYGTPTLNPSTGSYRLGSLGMVLIELGDLFDETGVGATWAGELASGEEYLVRARAVATSTSAASGYSAVLRGRTRPRLYSGCAYSLGFWKNFPEGWPVGSLALGSVVYDAKQLEAIFATPARGNGLVMLAHQLIAAKLNLANGADPSVLAAMVAEADAKIGALVVPPLGKGYIGPDDVRAGRDGLDSFNNGLIGAANCAQVPSRLSTWGGIKAVYR